MKRIIIIITALICSLMAFSQAKKPTIMVVPSDAWCNQNQFVKTFDNQGTTVVIPDYLAAFQNDMDLKLVIAKINSLMAERGFPLKDLEQTTKSIAQSVAEDNMTTSKTSGASLAENPVDRLRRTAKADIIIDLSWAVKTQGPKQTLTYIMEAKDPYTNKSIGGASGASSPSFSADVSVLLEEAVLANIDNFNNRLQSYFDDLFANGREVALDVRVFDNGSGVDLESEFGGQELAEIIDDWMAKNTVQGRFTKMDGSENYISYEQVRIPLFKPNGTAMDTESFARELRKVLQKEPYNLTVKLMNRGLGKTILVIGEK